MSQGEVQTKSLNDLTVVELKNELKKRNVKGSGRKPILQDQLFRALKAEGHDVQSYRFGTAELHLSTQQPDSKVENGAVLIGEPSSHPPSTAAVVDEVQSTSVADDGNANGPQIAVPMLCMTEDEFGGETELQALEAEGHDDQALDVPVAVDEQPQPVPSTPVSAVGVETAFAVQLSREDESGPELAVSPIVLVGTKAAATATTTTSESVTTTAPATAAAPLSSSSSSTDQPKLAATIVASAATSGGTESSSSTALVANDEQKQLSTTATSGTIVTTTTKLTNESCVVTLASVESVVELSDDQHEKTVAKEATSVQKSSSNSNLSKPTSTETAAATFVVADGDNHLSSSLWIRNMTTTTKRSDLKALFSKHGKVVTEKIFTTKNKQSRAGFVTLEDAETADVCVQKLNRSNFKGRIISVEKADRSNLSQIGAQQQQRQQAAALSGGKSKTSADTTMGTTSSGGGKEANKAWSSTSGGGADGASSSKVQPCIIAASESTPAAGEGSRTQQSRNKNNNSSSNKASSSSTSIRKRISQSAGGGTSSANFDLEAVTTTTSATAAATMGTTSSGGGKEANKAWSSTSGGGADGASSSSRKVRPRITAAGGGSRICDRAVPDLGPFKVDVSGFSPNEIAVKLFGNEIVVEAESVRNGRTMRQTKKISGGTQTEKSLVLEMTGTLSVSLE